MSFASVELGTYCLLGVFVATIAVGIRRGPIGEPPGVAAVDEETGVFGPNAIVDLADKCGQVGSFVCAGSERHVLEDAAGYESLRRHPVACNVRGVAGL